MIFEQNKTIEKLGEKAGYIFGYFLFTTILFLFLILLKKTHEWSYLYAIGITILIIFTGTIIKRLLR